MKGHFVLVLHAHLPFVRHPKEKDILEERWLMEAMLETYLPLLRTFSRLEESQVAWKMTMSFSPPLVAMLRDEYLQKKYDLYIENLLDLLGKEKKRNIYDPHLSYLTEYYEKNILELHKIFDRNQKNILNEFKKHFEKGNLEIITTPATHGFLPLMESEPSSVKAQISNGRRSHRETWGKDPKGIWLSECGYYPGLEWILEDNGIKYFFCDSHGILNANPRPKFGVHAPVEVGGGVFAFARDPISSRQVWSSVEGFPGDHRYREYYRDIGYDLEWEYIRPHLPDVGIRVNTGIKYHRITGKTDHKDYYHPDWAMEACGNQAEHFLQSRIAETEGLSKFNKQNPVLVSPFDAELFGHWWYEGPLFLEFLFKKMHFHQDLVVSSHALDVVSEIPKIQSVKMEMCSWGENGYNEVWLNPGNDWIYRHLLNASIEMREQSFKFQNTKVEGLVRILNQMGRELLLAQSSDWAFIIKTGTMVEYAERRTVEHIQNFLSLVEILNRYSPEASKIEEADFQVCKALEEATPIFPSLHFKDYLS